MTDLKQPKHLQCGLTRTKKIPSHLINKIREMADVPYENSFCINFEESEEGKTFPTLTTSSLCKGSGNTIITRGGFHPFQAMTATERIEKCDIFGHSHPNWSDNTPSLTDLENMKACKPEFILAKDDIYFLNIENKKKLKDFIEIQKNNPTFTMPRISIKKNKYWTNEDVRKLFFEETGVKVYPYKKDMLIEFKQTSKLKTT